jgi:glycosyltransferase involved in cell wall biosynthesis
VKRTAIHQLVPSVVPGDATTAHTLQVQRLLRDLGFHSEVYATAVHEQLEGHVRLLHELRGPSRRDGFLMYQLSAQSPLGDWLSGRLESVAVNYHNITPAHCLRGWNRPRMLELSAAHVQVAQLARHSAVGICDSSYNAADLRAKGWEATTVVPILLDLAEFDADSDPDAEREGRRRQTSGSRWLSVGAISPHKCQHHVVRAFALYRRVYDPHATLTLVGRPAVPSYFDALRHYVQSLELDDAVVLPGGVTHAQLVAQYRAADVYLSASVHEGFCVPLLEAMYHDVPVVALRAGAVAETLGHAGLLVDSEAPAEMAASVWRAVSDQALRARLRAAGRHRLDHFSLERTRSAMATAIQRWVDAAGSWPRSEDDK